MADAIEKAGQALPAVSGEVRFAGFGDVWRFAEALAEARGFVPDAYLGKPAALAACVMTALELGIGPMEGIRTLHNVKGKIMLDASLVAKLAIRGGVAIDYEVCTDTECRVRLSRGGRSHVETFTLRDAERAGLTQPTRSGEPSMYAKYPRRMLQARALGIGVRAWCPDVIGGAVYVEGELDAPAEQPRAVEAHVLLEQPPATPQGSARRESPLAAAKRALESCVCREELDAWAAQHRDLLAGTRPENRDRMRAALCDRVARVGGGEEWSPEEAGAVVARVAAAAGLGEEAAQ